VFHRRIEFWKGEEDSLKTLLMSTKVTLPSSHQHRGINFSFAGFEVAIVGRIWVAIEDMNPRRMKMRRRCRKSASARSADFHPRHIIQPKMAVVTETPTMTMASSANGLSDATGNHFLRLHGTRSGFYCND
jgi:hypothetical protein